MSDRRLLNRFGPIEVAVFLTLVLLLGHAAVYAFLTDDAFISFRYARNLAGGHGLVFNPGFERVEGYTNFLWVLLLAGFDVLGLAPESVANVLSIAATIALWALVVWFVYRTPPAAGRRWLLLVAPLCLAATRSVAVWSTSGLETRLFEVLVVGGALRLIVEIEARTAGRSRRGIAVFLFALATLTRPDGLLISLAAFAVAGGQLMRRRCKGLRPLAVQVGIYAAIVGGHYAFRLAYYGQWLPNTYYAKVGGQTWWDMGLIYLHMFAIEYAAYLWLPLLIAAWAAHRTNNTLFRPMIFAAVVLPHALYIVSIGGDHFEYRPLDLYFPFVFILLYDGASCLARSRTSSAITAAYLVVVLIGLTALPYQSHRQFPKSYLPGFPGRLEDFAAAGDFMRPERDPLYRLPVLRQLAATHRRLMREATTDFVGIRQEEHRLFLETQVPGGRRLRRLVEEGLIPADTHVALAAIGAVPYYSDLRTLDRLGLTDAHVAHAESPARGRRTMAHDKRATLDYARAAGVDFWAFDGANCLLHVGHPDMLANVLVISHWVLPVHIAAAGDGYYMLGWLPQGIEHARLRFPRLEFKSLDEPEVLWAVVREAVAHLRREDPRWTENPFSVQRPAGFETDTMLDKALDLIGQRSDGAEFLEQIAADQPRWDRPRVKLAERALAGGDMAGALVHMQAAVVTGGAEPEVWSKTAWLLLQAGRPDEAADHFRHALGGNPDDPDALMGLGRVLLDQGDYPEAIDTLDHSVRIRPADPATLLLLADALAAGSRHPQAIEILGRARDLTRPGAAHADPEQFGRIMARLRQYEGRRPGSLQVP